MSLKQQERQQPGGDSGIGSSSNSSRSSSQKMSFAKSVKYPDTARWCLCGMKNLTRPSKDPLAAQELMQAGVLDVLLSIVSIEYDHSNHESFETHHETR
jgi:hypothetical protein